MSVNNLITVSNLLLLGYVVFVVVLFWYSYFYFKAETGYVKCYCGGRVVIGDGCGRCVDCNREYDIEGVVDLIFRRLK